MKKKILFLSVFAVAFCIIAAVLFLMNSDENRKFPIDGSNVSELDTEYIINNIAKAEKLEKSSNLYVNTDNFDIMLTENFDWANNGAICFFYEKNLKTYSAQLRMFHNENRYFVTDSSKWREQEERFLLAFYLNSLKYMPQDEIRKLSDSADGYIIVIRNDGVPDDYERVLQYSKNGVENYDGWHIHLEIQPLHKAENGGFSGFGDEVIHIFYVDI